MNKESFELLDIIITSVAEIGRKFEEEENEEAIGDALTMLVGELGWHKELAKRRLLRRCICPACYEKMIIFETFVDEGCAMLKQGCVECGHSVTWNPKLVEGENPKSKRFWDAPY